jgi:hypothetical protein
MTSTSYDTVRPIIAAGLFAAVGGTVTRPADTAAYAVGDLIANNTVAASVVPIALPAAREADRTGMVRALRLKVNDTAWKAGVVRVHLFRDSPTVAVGDNGVLNASETYAFTESNYMGYCDITLSQQTSDGYVKGFGVRSVGAEWNFDPAPGTVNIFALLEARTAVTPGSAKIFSLVAEVLRN